MRYDLHNDTISAQIDDLGCQLTSLRKQNHEYMWSADKRFWDSSSLVLFPFIGRNYEDTYIYKGQRYEIPIHGFASSKRFDLLYQDNEKLLFSLKQDDETLKKYPFNFELMIGFQLQDSNIKITFELKNDSNEEMIYDLGFHPGFALDDDLNDYYVEFPDAEDPEEILIVTRCMLTGEKRKVTLDENILKLDRSMFKNSARVFTGIGNQAILKNNKNNNAVTIRYDGFDNIVLWQTLNSDAPFLCIEEWKGLPGHYEIIEDIEKVSSKSILAPGCTDKKYVSITI